MRLNTWTASGRPANSGLALALMVGFVAAAVMGLQASAAEVTEETLPSPEASPFFAGAPLAPPESEDIAPTGLRAEPRALTFRTRDAEGRVRVFRNGEPVPSGQISGLRALIDGKDYSRMFSFEVSDEEPGEIIVRGRPTTLEIGIYDIRFQAAGEEGSFRVRAPLDGEPDSLQRRAQQRGVTVEDLLREYGFTRPMERGEIIIRMPGRFYEGQIMRLGLAHSPGQSFTWIINGEVVLEGEDASTLSHALTEPGTHTLRVEERSNGRLVAEWEGDFYVAAEPAVEWTITERQRVSLPGPEGFGAYTWLLDGREIAEGPVFEHTFEAPGVYTVECVAREPEDDERRVLRRVTWEVNVEPRA